MAEAGDPREEGRRQGKSAAAFRTISEVAEDLDVPPHVLRFWEGKFAQVKPLKRGGGRRYYRPEDVELLRGIRELLYTDGYTIKGVQKLLREGGVKAVLNGSVRNGGTEDDPASEATVSVEPGEGKAGSPAAGSPSSGNAAAMPSVSALSPHKREVLEGVLEELESLREFLRV